MRWLLRRVLTMWLILLGICVAAILLARLIRAPGSLQAFGFDVCDGDPCFRGIRVGMDWETVRARLTDGQHMNASIVEFKVGSSSIAVRHNDNIVQQIKLSSNNPGNLRTRMTIGAIIAHYGPPCSVRLKSERLWEFIYPNSLVEVVLAPPNFRLHMNLPAYTFTVRAPTPCKNLRDELNGVWRGLTTSDVYRALFRRSAAVGQ